MRGLYEWVVHWARTRYGIWALFLLAVSEASFFPIPPDALLIALAISVPNRSFLYALICSVGSVLGGIIGYIIGFQFMDLVGMRLIELYGGMEEYLRIQELYRAHSAWAVGIAGFTPIPYKVFTIAAGAFKINFPIFLAASAVSRSARFFLVGGFIHRFGPRAQPFIERHFNRLAVVFVVLLVLGFIIVKIL